MTKSNFSSALNLLTKNMEKVVFRLNKDTLSKAYSKLFERYDKKC